MAALELLVRRGGVLESERAGDVRAQGALLDERRDVLAEVVARRAHEDVARLAVLARLGRRGDRDEPPALAQRREGLLLAVAAEEVEGGVGAAALVERADLRRDVLVVVDRLGAELRG